MNFGQLGLLIHLIEKEIAISTFHEEGQAEPDTSNPYMATLKNLEYTLLAQLQPDQHTAFAGDNPRLKAVITEFKMVEHELNLQNRESEIASSSLDV